jgi:23S rRNA pseudouridine2605 synthase
MIKIDKKNHDNKSLEEGGQRIAKVIARSGICSRRDAEIMIFEGRVKVNGKIIDNPATLITDHSIKVDNKLINQKQETKIWLFHKPSGYITTNKDPLNRKTIFDVLPQGLPRVVCVGRLDINTEGLLLLTNDGEKSRELEMPSNKWVRVYRARVYGYIDHDRLNRMKKGITIEGVRYGATKIEIEKEGGPNSWLKISLCEGKNREVKKLLAFCGLTVNRLIRTSFGPYNLDKIRVGEVIETSVKK